MAWIEGKKIATGVVSFLVIGLLGYGTTKAHTEWTHYKSVCAQVQEFMSDEQQQAQQQIQKQIEQIAIDVKAIKIAGMTVTGTARVQSSESTEVFMQINTLGRAELYGKQVKARVTNLSSEDSPSIMVTIKGTFQNRDENYLILLSRRAGGLLQIQPGTMAKVRIEPILEEKRDGE